MPEELNQPLEPLREDAAAAAPPEDALAAPDSVAAAPVGDAVPAAAPPTGETESLPPEVPEPAAEQTSPESEPPAPEPAAEAPVAEKVEEESAPEEAVAETAAEPAPKSENMNWYILKVQSNREDSIREGLLRRVAIAGLEYYFGEVIVPMERVTEFKGGKKRVIKRKLYPGYLVVQMEINDDTWFLVRETPGIGDFTGAAGRPTPMHDYEIERILVKTEEKGEKAPKLKIAFREGDRVKIKEGTFENFEGQVETIDQTNGQVTVMINIFGRSTPVTLEYWQIEAL